MPGHTVYIYIKLLSEVFQSVNIRAHATEEQGATLNWIGVGSLSTAVTPLSWQNKKAQGQFAALVWNEAQSVQRSILTSNEQWSNFVRSSYQEYKLITSWYITLVCRHSQNVEAALKKIHYMISWLIEVPLTVIACKSKIIQHDLITLSHDSLNHVGIWWLPASCLKVLQQDFSQVEV